MCVTRTAGILHLSNTHIGWHSHVCRPSKCFSIHISVLAAYAGRASAWQCSGATDEEQDVGGPNQPAYFACIQLASLVMGLGEDQETWAGRLLQIQIGKTRHVHVPASSMYSHSTAAAPSSSSPTALCLFINEPPWSLCKRLFLLPGKTVGPTRIFVGRLDKLRLSMHSSCSMQQGGVQCCCVTAKAKYAPYLRSWRGSYPLPHALQLPWCDSQATQKRFMPPTVVQLQQRNTAVALKTHR